MQEKSVCCTSLDPIMNSRRNKVEPILVIRGGINGQFDPAMVTTTVADRRSGTGLPARVPLRTSDSKLTGSDIILLRRMQAVSGGQLGRGVNAISRGSVGRVGGTVSVSFNLGTWFHVACKWYWGEGWASEGAIDLT